MTKDPNLIRTTFVSACLQPMTQFFYHKLLKPFKKKTTTKKVCIYLPLQYKRVFGPTSLPGRIRRIWLTT